MVTGMQAFSLNNQQVIAATAREHFYVYDGGAITDYGALDIEDDRPTTMVQANDTLYGTDGVNAPFKFDGTTAQNFVLNDAAGNPIEGITDLIYFLGRMWYAKDDFIYFSDVFGSTETDNALALETITSPPIRVKVGDGGVIRRIIGSREGLMLVFKFAPFNGPGSVHVSDVSSNDPSQFTLNVRSLYDGLNFCSPRAVIALGNDQNAEIFYATNEGYRSLPYTSLDKLIQPSLPFSYNLADELARVNPLARDASFSVVFNDELLWFVATGINTTADTTLCHDMKLPRASVQNGWSTSNLMPATCACVAAINGAPKLYIGTTDDTIQLAMAVETLSVYTEISKRIDYGDPYSDKEPQKLVLTLAPDHSGSINVFILYDDDSELNLGTIDVTTGGVSFPTTFPVTFTAGVIQTVTLDIRDSLGQRKVSKDFRVKITTAYSPSIYGYQLESVLCPQRWKQANVTQNAGGYGDLPTQSAYGTLPDAVGA